MADQKKYLAREKDGSGDLLIGEDAVEAVDHPHQWVQRDPPDCVSLSRAEALELFKQLSKELGFTTPSFTCLYKHLGHCTGPTVLECWDGDPEHEGYDYICEGHQDRYRKKHQSPDLFIRDMRDIPKEGY